jgi:hypothetical protein
MKRRNIYEENSSTLTTMERPVWKDSQFLESGTSWGYGINASTQGVLASFGQT